MLQDESRQGLTYFHETIYKGLPVFLRRIDTALKNIGQPMLPLDSELFTFGSWMGGDRDGNPFVTPQTTRWVGRPAGGRAGTHSLAVEVLPAQGQPACAWRHGAAWSAAAGRKEA